MELSEIVGRKVDLRTPEDLSRYFRAEVVSSALPNMNAADRIRIQHMLDAAGEAAAFVKGRVREDLARDRLLLLALVKEIEIVGEAATQISEELR